MESCSLKIEEVVFREDLYPRFEPKQYLIEQYAEAIDNLPPILVNQNNILIDGFHRWKAHQLAKKEEIAVGRIDVESEAELEILAYRYNSQHGLQLSSKEKEHFAQKKIGILEIKDIAGILSVPYSTVRDWTVSQRKALNERRNQQILEMYLRAWNTQEMIAEEFGLERSSVTKIIDNVKNGEIAKIHKDFEPYLYNIWNLAKADKSTSHFGYFPEVFMENLLYRHTEPMSVIYDPFAGSGVTVDVCKKWLRRYYCSDRIVQPGREKDIRQWDVNDGLPDDLPSIDFAFLDPPYWKQAAGQYSEDKEDLGNMSLDDFNGSMSNLFAALSDKKADYIALVIQPTQYSNEFEYIDHVFDFHGMINCDYRICMRYVIPYSTEQYNAQQVLKAKETGYALALHRDLVVWRQMQSG